MKTKIIEINEHIVTNTDICHGKPTFKGTRIMVWQILEMLEAGETNEEIINAFPILNTKQIKAALNYAASLTKSGNYVIVNTKREIPA